MDLVETIAASADVEGSLVRVHRVLNHRIEPGILTEIATQTLEVAAPESFDVVVTAEASGIAPAAAVASMAHRPMVYAKKWRTPPSDDVTTATIPSPTKGGEAMLGIDGSVLAGTTTALIVDDFLSSGTSALALGDLVTGFGLGIRSFVFVVEKAFLGGRRRLTDRGWEVHSLVSVDTIVPDLRMSAGT